MLTFRRVLLASHGTPGARAAGTVAFDSCPPGATLAHLVVVPGLWRGMMGDDWLNNASTRAEYGRHVEMQLAREIEAHCAEVERDSRTRGVCYETRTMIGEPAECLIAYAAELHPDLIVIGAPRPRGVPGLRSRMRVDALINALAAPLLIVPHPK